MNEFIKKLDFYIESYDVEKRLYEEGKEWRKKGYLTKDEFMQICLWKSRRAKKRYDSNDAALVEKITREAFAESDEKKKEAYRTQRCKNSGRFCNFKCNR